MRVVSGYLSILLFSLGIAANHTQQAKAEINDHYSAMTVAFLSKDFASLKNFMTDDFSASGGPTGGPVTRDQMVKDFQGERDRLSDIKWSKKIRRFRYAGKAVEAEVDGSLDARINLGDTKKHTFSLRAISDDDWVKVGDAWKLRSSKVKKFDLKIDGKAARAG